MSHLLPAGLGGQRDGGFDHIPRPHVVRDHESNRFIRLSRQDGVRDPRMLLIQIRPLMRAHA